MIIDSHHHLWNYDPIKYDWISESMPVLRRDFLTADLIAATTPSGVTGVVTVQAQQTVVETTSLLEFAEQCSLIRGVVGWLPLAADESELLPLMDRFAARPPMKGLRHVVQGEPDTRFLLRDDFNRGVRRLLDYGWVYDILIYAKQLRGAIEFVDLHPQQRFVLDHIAKPTVAVAEFDSEWAKEITELAKRDNVMCKFSGVATEVRDPEWSPETIRPYWETTLAAFGIERMMFGSDWPVCLLRTKYDRWVDCVRSFTAQLSGDEQQRFWHDNAVAAYDL